MPDEPAYIDWLTTIEPEAVAEASSKYGNRYVEITEEQGVIFVVRAHFDNPRSRRGIL